MIHKTLIKNEKDLEYEYMNMEDKGFQSVKQYPKSYPCILVVVDYADGKIDTVWEIDFVYPNDLTI
jgi:hypothetical protein